MCRWLAALFILGAVEAAGATSYAKVIYVAGCQVVQGSPPTGLDALWTTDAVAASGWTPAITTVLYCDAGLPPTTTAFDYADLEYCWQPVASSDEPPTAAAFVDLHQEQSGAVPYSMSLEIGECSAIVATQGSETSICRTSGGLSFLGPGGALFPASVHFLVYLPPITDSTISWVYRLVVHYEAP